MFGWVRNKFRASSIGAASYFVDFFNGRESESGVAVNARTALNYAYVWQALNLIAGDVGQMPLNIFKETKDGRTVDTQHAARKLLRFRPNKFMNASTFKETLQSHALMWGNGRAGILRNPRGEPVSLTPFLPDRSYSQLVGDQVWHFTRLGDSAEYTPFRDENVLHIKGLGYDGVQGYSVISLARDSWGLGLAAERHGSRTFKNGARPSVVLEADGSFTADQAKQLLLDWQALQGGLENVGKTALLQRGIKAKTLTGMSNADAQWLDLREFQRQEVASWFILPPHKLGDSTRAGYNSLEQENQSYVQTTLMRWITAWQEECREKLLTQDQKDKETHVVEFNTANLLRGDLLARYRAYQIGISSEFLSPDEVRGLENLNKRPDGKGGTYQNPNTKPGYPDSETRDAARAMASSRIGQLINVEMNRVKQAAKKPESFISWLDKFYGAGGFESRYVSLFTSLGGDAAMAQEHCEKSKNDLLEEAGRSDRTTLASNVSKLVASWPGRADAIADAMDFALAA